GAARGLRDDMQLSIPNPALLPRAGPYSRAIVGYGIHWNHLAECTTPTWGSCRPSPGICLRSPSFRDSSSQILYRMAPLEDIRVISCPSRLEVLRAASGFRYEFIQSVFCHQTLW